MKIEFIEIQNFRKLKSCHIELSNKETLFAGAYLNNGGSVPNPLLPFASSIGMDISNTTVNSSTNQSTTGITLNISLGFGPPKEGHSRIGKTNIKNEERTVIFDFTLLD